MTLRILIADDEKPARFGMAKALAHGGYHLLESADVRSTIETIRANLPDLVFLDLTMPDGDGRAVLRELAGKPPCEIVVVTAHDDVQTAVECLRLGAADYLTKPYEIDRVRAIARNCAERHALAQRARELQDRLDQRQAFGALVGVSRPMQALYRQVERLGPTARCRPDSRRNRDRQGADRPRAAPPQRSRRRAVRSRQLRCDSRSAVRERAVRPRQGRLHRRRRCTRRVH